MMLLRCLVAWAVLAGAATAQNWQPLGLDTPFPPTGTRVCVEGGGQRVCLALFCNGPGTGLRVGWIDTTLPATLDGVEMYIGVDESLAFTVVDSPNPTVTADRLPGYPYFVASGFIDPIQAAPLIEALKRANTAWITIAGNGIGLPLRGSSREIARAEGICGPPASPLPSVVPITPPEPVQPERQGLAVGSAVWSPVPPSPVEDVFGTELCWPARPGAPADRCFRIQCFAPGSAINLLYEDRGLPPGAFQVGTPFPTRFSTQDGSLSVAFDWQVAESRSLIVADISRPERWPTLQTILSSDAPLRVEMPYGVVEVTAQGFASELSRVAQICAVPVAAPPAQTQVIRFDFNTDELWATPPEMMAQVNAAQGAAIAAYRQAVGADLTGLSARAYAAGEDDVILATVLCGRGGWFGAKGCMTFLDIRRGGTWQPVFSDAELAHGGTLDLDYGNATNGWPALVINGGAVIWTWNGRDYVVTR